MKPAKSISSHTAKLEPTFTPTPDMTQTTPENAAWKEFLLSTRSGDLVRSPKPLCKWLCRYPPPNHCVQWLQKT
jgi:hypothetical protein